MNPDPTSLDRLHDIVVPPPEPWWPPAPGWYWVIGLLGVLFLLGIAGAFRSWQRNRYRREALAQLSSLGHLLTDPTRRAQALASAVVLLKRAALSAWPRREVASLTGVAWQRFLDRTGKTTDFTQGNGSILEPVASDPRAAAALTPDEAQAALEASKRWLRHHRQMEEKPC